MGVKLGPGEFHAIVGGRCNFYSADSQKEVFLQVTDPALLDSFAHVGGVPVTGIGDKAIWLDGSVYVQKDGNVMQIGFSLPGPLKTMSPDAEKLAKIVASRM